MTKQLMIGAIIGAAAVTLLSGVSLSWLLILACPLMMVFMHGGHRHGGHGREESDRHRAEDSPVSRDEHLAHRG